MKAVVYHGVGDIRLDNIKEPTLKHDFDAIVRLTASAICGTDLHFVRGTVPGMQEGTVLGHEGVGVVEEVGKGVRNVKSGDRVVIPSTIACGYCSYCRAGYYAQCDNANPNGPLAAQLFSVDLKRQVPFMDCKPNLPASHSQTLAWLSFLRKSPMTRPSSPPIFFPPATSAPK